jgi:hypothetical protein
MGSANLLPTYIYRQSISGERALRSGIRNIIQYCDGIKDEEASFFAS